MIAATCNHYVDWDGNGSFSLPGENIQNPGFAVYFETFAVWIVQAIA